MELEVDAASDSLSFPDTLGAAASDTGGEVPGAAIVSGNFDVGCELELDELCGVVVVSFSNSGSELVEVMLSFAEASADVASSSDAGASLLVVDPS